MDRTFFRSGCCTPAIPQMPEEEAAAYRRVKEALEDETHAGTEGTSRRPETMVSPMRRPEKVLTHRWDPYPGTAPGILCPTSSLLHSSTPHQRLLPKSRLSAVDEPPAEEADEAPRRQQ